VTVISAVGEEQICARMVCLIFKDLCSLSHEKCLYV
jgi:hypothetical protein